jgi:N-acetylglucosamine malate deacetylase 1
MASILVVGPHPDDQELGMGGTIAVLASQGHRVHLLDMTDGSPTPYGTRETRLPEAQAALAALQPTDEQTPRITRQLLDLPNREVEHSIAARHAVAGVIRATQAQIVFTPYFQDAHPDHLAVTRIVEDARFDAKLTKVSMPGDGGMSPIYPKWLIYYYATHLRIVPSPSFLVDITSTADMKHRAIDAYASQFANNPKNHDVHEWVRAQDRYFGSRIGVKAAEPFFTREPLGLMSLSGVVGV